MRAIDNSLASGISGGISSFERDHSAIWGIRSKAARDVFIAQLVESVRRVRYYKAVTAGTRTSSCLDPASSAFNPIKGAVLRQRQGQIDEAFWLVFVAVHFGRNRKTGWTLAREVYGRLGSGAVWDWATTSKDPKAFRTWLRSAKSALTGRFGNHRKYISLDADSNSQTGAAFQTYVEWIGPHGHQPVFSSACAQNGEDPREAFRFLFSTMKVASFGRMGRFDYLATISNLGFAPIEPGSTFMGGATGPYAGARLLFGGSKSAKLTRREADSLLISLESYLGVGMQVMEDAVCNWQKSPAKFISFRG